MSIENYWPEDTHDTIYLCGVQSMADILAACQRRFGADIRAEQILIHSEHIHTYNTTYDLYASGDYTMFIVCELDSTV